MDVKGDRPISMRADYHSVIIFTAHAAWWNLNKEHFSYRKTVHYLPMPQFKSKAAKYITE